jgi:methyltransferase (TIGR00027 family)
MAAMNRPRLVSVVVVIAFTAVVFSAVVQGVEPGKPSKTAIMAAAFRAIGARNPDQEFRNPDFLAGRFLRREDLATLAANGLDLRGEMTLAGDAFTEYLHRSIAITTNFVRTIHIDTSMRNCIADGATQVVVLGAGLDSRAYRFGSAYASVTFYEVDFPPTLKFKTERVRQVLGRFPKNVRYVPVDFTKDDLRTQLLHAGYREQSRTFFVWEGVVFYIPESAVRGTLRFVAEHSGAGSQIIFDYALATNRRINNPNDLFARWGEPFVFGFPAGGPSQIVREEGLRLTSDLANDELVRKYAVRPDGTSSLRVPDGEKREADDAGFALAEVPTQVR